MNATELLKVLENHQLWLENNGGERANLADANLSFTNLRCANLRGTNLRGADLAGALNIFSTPKTTIDPRALLG